MQRCREQLVTLAPRASPRPTRAPTPLTCVILEPAVRISQSSISTTCVCLKYVSRSTVSTTCVCVCLKYVPRSTISTTCVCLNYVPLSTVSTTCVCLKYVPLSTSSTTRVCLNLCLNSNYLIGFPFTSDTGCVLTPLTTTRHADFLL